MNRTKLYLENIEKLTNALSSNRPLKSSIFNKGANLLALINSARFTQPEVVLEDTKDTQSLSLVYTAGDWYIKIVVDESKYDATVSKDTNRDINFTVSSNNADTIVLFLDLYFDNKTRPGVIDPNF